MRACNRIHFSPGPFAGSGPGVDRRRRQPALMQRGINPTNQKPANDGKDSGCAGKVNNIAMFEEPQTAEHHQRRHTEGRKPALARRKSISNGSLFFRRRISWWWSALVSSQELGKPAPAFLEYLCKESPNVLRFGNDSFPCLREVPAQCASECVCHGGRINRGCGRPYAGDQDQQRTAAQAKQKSSTKGAASTRPSIASSRAAYISKQSLGIAARQLPQPPRS